MPQDLRVVQCAHCQTFQGDIVKKSDIWQCKICNAKQKVRKVLHQGSGLDCRNMVKELNQTRMQNAEQKANDLLYSLEAATDDDILLEAAQIEQNYEQRSEI